VFGRQNFVAQLDWEKKKKGAFLSKNYINMKEYVLVYARKNSVFSGLVGERTNEKETYPCIKTTNARGIRVIPMGTPSKYKYKDYEIAANTKVSSGNMELIYLDDVIVRRGILQKDVRVYIRRIVNDERIKMLKDLLTRVGNDGKSLTYFTYDSNLNNGGWGTNEDANDELHKLLGQQYLFDYSKPSRLIGKLIQTIDDDNAIIMDFFSGSATTADAVLRLNALDKGKRKFILVQVLDNMVQDSPAFKAGFKSVCEIGEERIRRAGKKIKEETGANIDYGFRVFKVDSSNMEDVFYAPENTFEQDLFKNNIKADRSAEDLLFQVMLDLGIKLSAKIRTEEIGGKKVFNVEDGCLVACFDEKVTEETITAIAKEKPRYFVMKDSSMADDSVATNFEQIFKTYSPQTIRKVL
jgi:adenine-specific DNA-methyltransferase